MSKHGRWPGTWRAICDRCGFEFPSSMLRKDWQGLMLCHDDWETRHPQDFVRGIPDNQTPPWTRPEPADVFIDVSYTVPLSCTPTGSSATSGYGVAGCMVAGRGIGSMDV